MLLGFDTGLEEFFHNGNTEIAGDGKDSTFLIVVTKDVFLS